MIADQFILIFLVVLCSFYKPIIEGSYGMVQSTCQQSVDQITIVLIRLGSSYLVHTFPNDWRKKPIGFQGQTFMVNFRGAKEDRNNTNKARIFKHHMHNGIVNVSVVCSTPCGKKSTKDNRRT